jgi:hypothetical protein
MITKNPEFDDPAASSSGTGTTVVVGASETTAATTLDSTSQDPSGTTASTTQGSSGTDAESTAALPPGSIDVPATVASCVLLPYMAAPYAGPQFCEQNAVVENGTGQAGVLILDEGFEHQGGNGRPARVLLRFEVPAALAGRTLTSVVLLIKFADGETAGSDWSGDLHAVEPFSGASLGDGAPAYLDLLAGDPGPSEPGQTVKWALSPEAVTAGQSAYFGLAALGGDGVLLLGEHAVTGAPTLRIDYE